MNSMILDEFDFKYKLGFHNLNQNKIIYQVKMDSHSNILSNGCNVSNKQQLKFTYRFGIYKYTN